ncbi:MAG: ribonuclease D [Magnetospirillum sp. WYHS-4]
MTLIVQSAPLAEFCARLKGVDYITVDTEFMREKTFWPQLCVLQVAGPEEAIAIDALAPGMDLAPLFDIFVDPSVLKVFHAARQDLEIFYHLMGRLPVPVFDTQVAAMVCGFGEQVGYDTLVAKLAKAHIDKSSRFTDWAIRPLSAKQIGYALADVTHLRTVYDKLKRRLDRNGRAGWLDEEMATLTAPETYAVDPQESFRRLKSRSASPRMLAVLREVAAWREREAQRRDLPRNRVLRDEALLEIAHHTPSTVSDLARTRGLGARLAEGSQGAAILEAVRRGREVPEEECPRPEDKPFLPRGIGPLSDLLKVLLKMKCEEFDVAQKLVASASDVDMIAAFGPEAQVPTLHGWRLDVFGRDALRLRAGEVALAGSLDGIHTVDIPSQEAVAEPAP